MASTSDRSNLPISNSNPNPHPASESNIPSQSETQIENNNEHNVDSTGSVHPQAQQPTLGNPISPSPPSLTLTPASPTTTQEETVEQQHRDNVDTEMIGEKGNQPTDSETALLSQQPKSSTTPNMADSTSPAAATSTGGGEPSQSTNGGALSNLTRKLSKSNSTSNSTSNPSKAVPMTSKEKEPSTTTPSNTNKSPPTTLPSASSSFKPAATTSSPSTQKKKKKRKGLAGFLLALGCLSADEFEEKPKHQQQTTQKPNTSVTTSNAKTAEPTVTKDKGVGEVAGAKKESLGHQVEPTATTGTTLVDQNVGEGDKSVKPNEEIVVAPAEPHTLPDEETAGVTSSAVQAPGGGSSLLGTPTRSHTQPQRRDSDNAAPSTSAEQDRTETSGGYTDISNSDIQDESSGAGAAHDEGVDEYGLEDEYEDEEDRLIEQGGMGIPLDENGQPQPLLPPILKEHHGRKCLVLDLDETLLHSSFKSLPSADYIVPVEIESQIHNVYVIKRPGVDHFLKEMGKIYEIVVFTASLSKYADPVLDMLDIHRVVTHRLFRESCYNHKGNYVKDLSQLGRSIETSIIIDNSPASYIFHPNNAVPVSTWFNDPHDTELTDLCPFLTDLATVDDIRGVLDGRMN
ncbi:hypothetical protein I302_108185 [Kwoniella bestiolae CBS 10118]|uniref:FCP1 homology domain-containing protein n=1 Tax=Kwoniella bestiolae CBS 10118 TaxID=1296100 RepID=A0A1B9FWF6_9TREE|nr:hypothetical protein I302_07449 [Kwoniella bestiolae CBS 10118]OCF23098.1 hypothetical protein I302_07449 [Kwoniella bestiolae CBS 10118]